MAGSNALDRAKQAGAVAAVLLAMLVGAWLLGYFEGDDRLSDDPQVADMQRAIQRSVQRPDEPIGTLVQDYKRLDDRQRAEVDRYKLLLGLPEQERELRRFFSQSEAEQRRQIEREITQMEEKRQRFATNPPPKVGKSKPIESDSRRILSLKKEWTANASPEMRAMMDRRLRMINQQRKERGLDPL